MPAEEVAQNLRAWAVESGLMPREHLGAAQPGRANVADIYPITENTDDLLRGRGIHFIGFNEGANEVILYTHRVVSKKMKASLPSSASNGTKISYQIGSAELIGKPPPSPFGTSASSLHNGRYTCGSSIHVGNRIGAGTLGCLVRDTGGTIYGLTNNHVTGNCSFASEGLPVLAPGPCDVSIGSVDPFCIGHHSKALRMVHGAPDNPQVQHTKNTDAALFKLSDPDRVSSMQKDNSYDTPDRAGDIEPGMIVGKVGRTTGRTAGIVRARISGPHGVRYKMPELDIDLVVFYEPLYVVQANTGYFSLPGDSGSLVTTLDAQNHRVAVGIVVAGDDKASFVLPIKPILDEFGVTLVSGHNI